MTFNHFIIITSTTISSYSLSNKYHLPQIIEPNQYIISPHFLDCSIIHNYMSIRNTPTLQQVQQENQRLREALRRLKEEQSQRKEVQQEQPAAVSGEAERRIQSNASRLRELQGLVRSQEQILRQYRERIAEFQQNLHSVMRLDKDIHQRLVSPQTSPALEANVRNVLLALNGKAPYDRLLKMLEAIKV